MAFFLAFMDRLKRLFTKLLWPEAVKTENKGSEEIEQHLLDQQPLLVRRDFQYFGVNSSLKRRRSWLAAIKMQALPPFHVLTASGQK